MKRVSLSGLQKTIGEIWDWYERQAQLSLAKRNQTVGQFGNNLAPDPLFVGMSEDDMDDFLEELDLLAIFDLLSATEAAIRVDFLNRVYRIKKTKDVVTSEFRQLHGQFGKDVALEEGILNAWKKNCPEAVESIGRFCGAMKMRHWLAHGRYWTPKFGMNYTPAYVYEIAAKVLRAIGA